MNPVVVRNVKIGEGMPKICVPLVGKTEEEILTLAKEACDAQADFVEWRADWFEDVFSPRAVAEVLCKLRACLGELPILFTFRTKCEGGEQAIDEMAYRELVNQVIDTGIADLVDVEVYAMAAVVPELIEKARACNVKVVGSNHDFENTPAKEEIVKRLCHMQELGVDIPKIAVMPQSKADVITLLAATEEMAGKHADRPIVTMSMSELGVVSRIEGEKYGSTVTFGSLQQTSAPGQVPARELRRMLEMVHHACEE